VQTGRRDEDAHEQQHPPDESDGKEQDGEEAKRADSPEVVRGHLDELSVFVFDEIMQQISSYRRIIWIEISIRVWRVVCSQQSVPLVGLSSRPWSWGFVRSARCGVRFSLAVHHREVFILAIVVLLSSPQTHLVVRLPAASVAV
jgi:hypothetical protein